MLVLFKILKVFFLYKQCRFYGKGEKYPSDFLFIWFLFLEKRTRFYNENIVILNISFQQFK